MERRQHCHKESMYQGRGNVAWPACQARWGQWLSDLKGFITPKAVNILTNLDHGSMTVFIHVAHYLDSNIVLVLPVPTFQHPSKRACIQEQNKT
jgi:hypothetical protein